MTIMRDWVRVGLRRSVGLHIPVSASPTFGTPRSNGVQLSSICDPPDPSSGPGRVRIDRRCLVGWLCSADGHVMEPADLWTSRVPQDLRDRAPRFEYTDTHRV